MATRARAVFIAQQLIFSFEALPFAQGLTEFDLCPHDGQQARILPRLLKEIARAKTHCFHRKFDATPRRHYNDGERVIDSLDSG